MTNARRAREVYLELLRADAAAWQQNDMDIFLAIGALLHDMAKYPCPLPYLTVTIR